MREKLEQTKEFIEEFELLRRSTGQWVFIALLTVKSNVSEYPTLYKWLFIDTFDEDNANANQITFAKIWAGEIELVEKKDKYVIYQIDDECNPWLLGIGVYGTLKNLPDFNANQPCEHGDYANKNCHFDQKFAFAMRDTGKFKIEKVVE